MDEGPVYERSATEDLTTGEGKRCPSCQLVNRVSARFCRRCGMALQPGMQVDQPLRLHPGMLLQGRYTVIRQIGESGLGRVFLAVDEQGRRYALKQVRELAPDADNEDYELYIRSIQREAQILSSLPHPYLPIARDFISTSTSFIIAMDYIEGQTLAELMEAAPGPIPERRALNWALQVCDALIYLHSKRPPIIHRNIKTKNIILEQGESDRVRLIGFGLARHYEEGLEKDEDNLGTPGFSPPEQYGLAQTDARSDVFSLGATLYALLSHHDPDEFVRFDGAETIQVDFPDLSRFNPEASPSVCKLVMRSLKLNPNERFQTAAEMKAAIEEILQDQQPQAEVESYQLNQPVTMEETRFYEFKEVKGGHPVRAIWRIIDQYVAAFLNSEGGRIFWGIRDSDRTVVGVKVGYRQRDEIRRAVLDKIMHIQPAVSPSAFRIHFHPVSDGDQPISDLFVIEVVVPRALTRFLYFTADGEVFVKTEAGKKKLSGSEIQDEIIRRLQS